MRKERKAQIVTVVVLAGALGAVLWKQMPLASVARREATAQDAVYAMLDAAKAGDVEKYLDSYTGEILPALKQSVAESGREKFSKYLRDSQAIVRGVAVMELEPPAGIQKKLRVEYIYQDRNEVQTMQLDRAPGGWKISKVDSTERVKTLVPYGSPVE